MPLQTRHDDDSIYSHTIFKRHKHTQTKYSWHSKLVTTRVSHPTYECLDVEVDDVRVRVVDVHLQPLDGHGQGLGVVDETGVRGTTLRPPSLPVRRLLQVLVGEVAEGREVASSQGLRDADGRVGHVIILVRVDVVASFQDLVGDHSVRHSVQVT